MAGAKSLVVLCFLLATATLQASFFFPNESVLGRKVKMAKMLGALKIHGYNRIETVPEAEKTMEEQISSRLTRVTCPDTTSSNCYGLCYWRTGHQTVYCAQQCGCIVSMEALADSKGMEDAGAEASATA